MIKLETHSHVIGTSKCADCDMDLMIKKYKQAGYGGITVVNHMHPVFINTYPGETLKERLDYYFSVYDIFSEKCKKEGIKTFLGTEVLIDCKEGHAEYILLGFDRDFIYDNVPLYTLNQKELFSLCDKNGVFMYKAHPFRTKEITGDPKFMHGAESFNGHYHHKNNNEEAKRFCDENNLVKLSGTDFHHSDQPITAGILISEEINDEKALVKAIINGEYTLIEEEEVYQTFYEKHVEEKNKCS